MTVVFNGISYDLSKKVFWIFFYFFYFLVFQDETAVVKLKGWAHIGLVAVHAQVFAFPSVLVGLYNRHTSVCVQVN